MTQTVPRRRRKEEGGGRKEGESDYDWYGEADYYYDHYFKSQMYWLNMSC